MRKAEWAVNIITVVVALVLLVIIRVESNNNSEFQLNLVHSGEFLVFIPSEIALVLVSIEFKSMIVLIQCIYPTCELDLSI